MRWCRWGLQCGSRCEGARRGAEGEEAQRGNYEVGDWEGMRLAEIWGAEKIGGEWGVVEGDVIEFGANDVTA